MAFYLVTRTDAADIGEYDAAIVRASGRRQALELVTKASDEGYALFPGFKADGSNARAEKLTDGRETPHAVLMTSFLG
ncbi:hypothetical protein P3T36_002979 [Kitasatospora sp. MAP12-15]|uniref:hypothetical protein n=1 Tax=unclassified Kitasatospora TaxID=2633591 RepID=UPI0024760EE6|nr:hypothetical protein [Kitasatospora sp. MAP12-44]MDH6108848.1 hypothetical protein [Kitasatospora sp. MAP12-44]